MDAPLIVLSFVGADTEHAEALLRHLSTLVAAGAIRTWHAGDVPPGSDREVDSRKRLQAATMVVCLLSADYLADPREPERALSAANENNLHVVPILVRECLFDRSPFAPYQRLPRGGRPVLSNPDRDAAWKEVALEIAKLLEAPKDPAAIVPADSGRAERPTSPPKRQSRKLPRWVAILAMAGVSASLLTAILWSMRGTPHPGPCPPGMVPIAGGQEPTSPDAGRTSGPGPTVAPFCIDRTEVSVAAYERCVAEPRGELGCPPLPRTALWPGTYSDNDIPLVSSWCNAGRPGFENHPANCVDWNMASAYCRWAGKSLPSGPEWRLAAGSGDRRKYPWGDAAPAPDHLNACGLECREMAQRAGRPGWATMYPLKDRWETTAPVGQVDGDYNELGVRDMGGNVSEWIADMGTPERQYRGGNWTSGRPEDAEMSHPAWVKAQVRDVAIGFRCVAQP